MALSELLICRACLKRLTFDRKPGMKIALVVSELRMKSADVDKTEENTATVDTN